MGMAGDSGQGQRVFTWQGHELRTATDSGTVWFVVADVAKALGISNPSMIVHTQVKPADKTMVRVDTLGGEQSLLGTNYTGVYEIIMGSRSANAHEFEAWFSGTVMKKLGLPVPG
jgi:prophage antirepressor-like protein